MFRLLLGDLVRFGGGRLWQGVLLGVVGAGLEGVGLLMLLPLLASVGVTQGPAWPAGAGVPETVGLGGLLLLWCVTVAALSWLAARREVALSRLNQDFVQDLRIRLHGAILAVDWSVFQQMPSTHATAALIGAAARVGHGLTHLILMLAGALLVTIHLGIAFFLAPAVGGVALAAGVILAVTQIPGLRRMNRHGTAMGEGMRTVQATVSEHLAAMKMAKCHNGEAAFARAFARDIRELGERTVIALGQAADSRARLKVGAALLIAALVWGSVDLLGVTGAPLLVLVAVLARLLPALAQVVQSALRVAEMVPAYGEIVSLRDHCRRFASPPPGPGGQVPQGSVRLEGVSYVWPGRERPAIADVTLEIPANRVTALIGPSGAGKSTLVDLCLGLLEPAGGRILVGGRVLEAGDRAVWRERCAVVPQDVFLFHDTIRANLEWANPGCGEDRLWQALGAAAVEDTVRSLPLGLDTVVGDRGVRLSGGERQRLALARALLRQPSLLVLDEATSHLDHESERLILRALDGLRGRMTVLMVAHRLSTVRHADLIAVLDGGCLREAGDWDRLCRPGGFLDRPFFAGMDPWSA